MKQIYYLLIALTLVTGCGNAQTPVISKNLTGNIKTDLKSLLSDVNVKADIMDGIIQTPRQVELTNKFQAKIQENYDWFLEYMKTVPEGEPMPYHPKLGVTENEYSELMGFFKNIELVSSGTENIIIDITNDTVHFKSFGKLSDFDSLKIDLKNNIVSFKEYKLAFSDTLDITTDKNAFKSKWKGYKWKFSEPNDLDLIDFSDLETLKIKQYELTIGVLEKNGKMLMSLKGREVADGVKNIEFEFRVTF